MNDICIKFISFLDESGDAEENYGNLITSFKNHTISKDQIEFKSFLHFVSKIANNHYRTNKFLDKIMQIINFFSSEIKDFFSNSEIFQIFKSNKLILLFLFESKILTLDYSILKQIREGKYANYNYHKYFAPEIKPINRSQKFDYNSIDITAEYLKNRKIGENEDYICKLIREDLIEEFIVYVNKHNYLLDSKIKESIFETNLFLLKNPPTLIEYSAFFGSVQIFKYLLLNKANYSKSIWTYAVHSNNPELIHYMMDEKICYHDNIFEDCIYESIKCHHNDIALYLIDNKINENDQIIKKNIISCSYRYYNYVFLKTYNNKKSTLVNACKNNHSKIVKDLLSYNIIELNSNQIKECLHYAASYNNVEILKLLFSTFTINDIDSSCFQNCKVITTISIPSYVAKIESDAFQGCTSLSEINFDEPSSLTFIGKNAFKKCVKLTSITIPSSVIIIKSSAFAMCESLSIINIPDSVTTIETQAFSKCSSLIEISIPSSVVSLGSNVFNGCKKLKYVSFAEDSLIQKIGMRSFYECESLTFIKIPQLVKVIEKFAFYDCCKLEQIELPSSLTSIGDMAFINCTSLLQISIPSSVTSIGNFAFYACNSLKQITIPSLIDLEKLAINSNVQITKI